MMRGSITKNCIDPTMDMAAIIRAAKECVKDISSEDLIKIIVTGETNIDTDIDCERLRRSLDQDFFFIKVYDRTSVQIDYESFRNDKSLKGEFVRLMERQHMSEDERAAIIELGMQAIMGEDIEV